MRRIKLNWVKLSRSGRYSIWTGAQSEEVGMMPHRAAWFRTLWSLSLSATSKQTASSTGWGIYKGDKGWFTDDCRQERRYEFEGGGVNALSKD